MHYIREVALKELVLENMRRVFLSVKAFEQDFVNKQLDCHKAELQRELQSKQREHEKSERRIAEIDKLIQRLYEDNVSGKLSDERFRTLSRAYEEEQSALKAKLPELEKFLREKTGKRDHVLLFVQKVRKITEPKELTVELVHEFIEKIVVYEAVEVERKRCQIVDIYYNGVGIIHTPDPFEHKADTRPTHKELPKHQ